MNRENFELAVRQILKPAQLQLLDQVPSWSESIMDVMYDLHVGALAFSDIDEFAALPKLRAKINDGDPWSAEDMFVTWAPEHAVEPLMLFDVGYYYENGAMLNDLLYGLDEKDSHDAEELLAGLLSSIIC